jgi:putative inorganic carbon (HCO3(-)) transporter
LAICVLNVSIQVGKHFFFNAYAQELGCDGGLHISLCNLPLAALYLAWLVSAASRHRTSLAMSRRSHRATLPATLFLLFTAVSLFIAPDKALASFGLWSVVEFVGLYLYIANTTISRHDVLFVFRILLIGLIFQTLLMLGQAAGVLGDFQQFGLKARAEFGQTNRISGTLGSPNPAAAYLAMAMSIAFGALLSNLGLADKILAGSSLLLGSLSLVFTRSRGGWLAFAVGIIIVAAFSRGKSPRRRVAVFVATLLLLLLMLGVSIRSRLSNEDQLSAESRTPLNLLALEMILDHPLFGVGANNFAVAMQPYVRRDFTGDWLYTVHNYYLLVWTETGAGGLIALLWVLVEFIRLGLRCSRSEDPMFAPLALGCMAAVIAVSVHMLFELFRGDCPLILLWLLGGLLASMNILITSPQTIAARPSFPLGTEFCQPSGKPKSR